MSAINTGNICSDALDQGDIVIGAFDATNTLRGYTHPVKGMENNNYNFYLTLYSNTEAEPLVLKYFNIKDGSVLQAASTITFATNQLAGMPNAPYVADVADSVACKLITVTGIKNVSAAGNIAIYPNPFTDNLNVTFNANVSVKIELVDVLGKLVYSATVKNKKEHNITFASGVSLSAGMYCLQISGDVNEQIKIIKTR